VSIDERPAIVDEKTRVGDWEIDLVIGKGDSGALVTIVARATSFTVSKRVNGKSADIVTAETISLLEPYRAAVLTITADNEKELAYPEKMAAALDATVYFADTYSSWQRGLNENTNGLLRQYWPKKTDFKKITLRNVTSVIVVLNNRPRKKLNDQTPASKMTEHMAVLAA
jgi:IS30 family transposase